MLKYLIRPHHLLCTRFFKGRGYSDEFCNNMSKIIKGLKNAQIVLTASADCICKICPNNDCGSCKSIEKVKIYDDSVLKLCSLTADEEYSYEQLYNSVTNNIILKNKLHCICSDCEWYGICSEHK